MSPRFSGNPESRSASTYTNGREFTTASTSVKMISNWTIYKNVKTNLANTISESNLHNSHKAFLKLSYPGCQFNDKAPFDS